MAASRQRTSGNKGERALLVLRQSGCLRCWRRRSLQFRYVADGATFAFGPNRLPHGPIPWTLAHAPGIAPHGLSDGDALAGPWYPLVHPAPRPEEHVPLTHKWSHGPGAILGLAAEAEANARDLLNASSVTTKGPFYGFDGPVAEPSEWAFVKVPPGVEMMYHTAGEGYKKAVADAA